MTLKSKDISKIYSGKVAKRYDISMSHFFPRFKKLAFQAAHLKNGDRVLVFCCGTGLDFPYILDQIGPEGEIVAVDFSKEMLMQAAAKIETHQWKNITLVEADITIYQDDKKGAFDAAVCILGISIIPNYKLAYQNLCSHVKPHGEVIIGDMQLATGFLSTFNPLTILLSKKFGGTEEGHKNSQNIRKMMQDKLENVRSEELFFHSYFYSVGNIK